MLKGFSAAGSGFYEHLDIRRAYTCKYVFRCMHIAFILHIQVDSALFCASRNSFASRCINCKTFFAKRVGSLTL